MIHRRMIVLAAACLVSTAGRIDTQPQALAISGCAVEHGITDMQTRNRIHF